MQLTLCANPYIIENEMYGQVVLLENKSKKNKDMDEVNLQKPVGDKLTFQELKVDEIKVQKQL